MYCNPIAFIAEINVNWTEYIYPAFKNRWSIRIYCFAEILREFANVVMRVVGFFEKVNSFVLFEHSLNLYCSTLLLAFYFQP